MKENAQINNKYIKIDLEIIYLFTVFCYKNDDELLVVCVSSLLSFYLKKFTYRHSNIEKKWKGENYFFCVRFLSLFLIRLFLKEAWNKEGLMAAFAWILIIIYIIFFFHIWMKFTSRFLLALSKATKWKKAKIRNLKFDNIFFYWISNFFICK